MKNNDKKLFFSGPEVAKILKVSRATVATRIRQGQIKAIRFGRNYAIPATEIEHLLGKLTEKNKKDITNAVGRAVEEYGEAIRMLGKE